MTTSEESRRILELYNDTELLRQKAARQQIDAFIEYVGKDSKGNRLEQADIHREIQEHIDLCKKRGVTNCGILAPWGHGKTEQILGRALDEIGKDRNIRIQIIANTDDNAMARVNVLARYIERDEEYHKVYPDVVPGGDRGDDWGKHKLVVQRESKSKDGTVESWGITTSGTGSRADLQIYDDPVDLRNAVLNPALRTQVKESFRNVWLSRLVPGGFRIYIATIWHEDDLTSELLKNTEWNFLVMKVSADFSCIECESPFKGRYTIPLWSAWNKERLQKQFIDLGERAFNRGYRQDAISDEDRTFPSSDTIFRWDLGRDIVAPHWPRCTGIDPFGKKVVIFTLALNPHNRSRVPVEIRIGKWDPRRTIREIFDVYTVHQPQIMVCENNASQQAILQWAQEVGGVDIPLVPFVTGKQKADPILGLPSLQVEFANGAWLVPMQGVDQFDHDNPFMVWRRELRSHPVGEAEDTVMASWFAREGARYLTREPDQAEEIVTQEEVLGTERVSIGEY